MVISKPKIDNFDYSFSGLKTSILYYLRDELKKDKNFIKDNIADISASVQQTIIDILIEKLVLAAQKLKIKNICIAGGVSANSGLRNRVLSLHDEYGWNVFIPPFQLTTDNAAMIAIVGYYKYLKGEFTNQKAKPYSR